MSCRFPGGADTPEKFWELLDKGIDPVSEIPEGRWKDDPSTNKNITTRKGSYLDDVEKFDPLFFGISPKEAQSMDPQQRLLLELHWEALEDAGWDPTSLAGTKTGVFVGISGSDYAQIGRDLGHSPGPYTFTGTLLNTAAGRISYVLGLQGPSMAIDTACSSSLVSVHQGMLQLRSGGCDVALVSGVNLILRAEGHVGTTSLGALSPSERCRSFDDSADGYIRSEGSAVLILKRLEDAKRDGDYLWGVIRGGAVNHDGRSGGLTVPNGLSQQQLIRYALSDSGLKPEDIDYVEAHGSATKIGDPLEVNALAEVFKKRKQSVHLGSVKSNLGHLEAAAGIAGLCKILLSMKHGRIPANLHFQKGNRLIKWDKIPLEVVHEPIEWKARQGVRRAGISAFGISGTNAHLVVESATENNKELPLNNTDAHLCTISAQSENALRQYVRDLADWCRQPTAGIAELCVNLNRGRASLSHRLALTVSDLESLEKRLDNLANSSKKLGVQVGEVQKPLVFLFTGQGSHYHNMARTLYEQSSVFRKKFDELDALFEMKIGKSLGQIIYGPETAEIHLPLYAQPLIFSIQIALAHFWESLGVVPDMFIGHSIGEYSAACLDGVVSMEDAIHMVFTRAYIMDETPMEGRMAGMLANESVVREMISKYDDVSIAAINSSENVTVSGGKSSMDDLVSRARKKRIFVEDLLVSHPFHSVMMKDRAHLLKTEFEKVTFHEPSYRFISSVYDDFIPEDVMLNGDYWVKHLVEPVRFSDALETAVSQGARVFLEIGGTATLCGLAAQNNLSGENLLFLPSLRKNRSSWKQIYQSLGRLWETGYPIQWNALYSGDFTRTENLPHTPYDRKKYWISDINVSNQTSQEIENTLESKVEQQIDDFRGKMDTHLKKIENDADIQESLRNMLEDIVEVRSEDITNSMNLFRFGLDSLMLVQLSEKIMHQYRLDIPIKMFFADLNTVNALSKYIHENCFESVNASAQELRVEEETSMSALSSLLEKMETRLIRIEERLTTLDPNDENIVRVDNNKGESNKQDLELTSDQQRVYFLSQLEGGNVANQIAQVYRLDNPIDINKLKKFFQNISDKHETLRSSFRITGSNITYDIADRIEPVYAEIDLRDEDGEAKFKDFFESPFVLSKPPLWRWGLVQDDKGYRLILNSHHTIADGYALNLILNDLSDLLNGVPLREVPKHYRDFVVKEQAFLNSKEAHKQREWWLNQLNPLPNSLDLPSDISRPEINPFGGSISKFTLDADITAAIKTLAKENNATTFMGVLAAWTAFLGKLSNQTDFCVAVPLNRRNVGDFKYNVGMFTQTIILRSNLDSSISFIDYLRTMKDTLLDAYSNGDYPFDMLLEELEIPRDMSRNPLFDVMVNYNTIEQKDYQFGDVKGVRDEIPRRYAQFDLFLDVLESDDEIIFRLNYAKPLFSQERIDDWIKRFQIFLKEIIKAPEIPFSDFELTHGAEQKLLSMGRGVKDENDKTTVNKLLSDVFKNKPTESAVWFQGKELSYKELGIRSRMLADHLMKLGVRPGGKIGILLSRTPDMLASMLAAIKLGCVFVPLDSSFPKERLRYMMEDSAIQQLISERTIMEYHDFSLPYLDPANLEMNEKNGNLEAPILNNEVQPSDIAYIIYTSGSTGKPKGVEIEHGSLANFTVGMAKALDWPNGARTACFTTSSFDIFLLETILCLVHGGCVVLSHNEAANPAEMAHIVTNGGVECLQMTPTRLQLLCADSKNADKVLKSVKVLIVGGEVFPTPLLPFLQSFPTLRIFNVYGPTETCVWSTYKELTKTETVSIGLPIANTNVYVLDKNRRLVSTGVIGDLWIGGSGVAHGYHNKPELTAERFVEEPFTDGRMYFTGDRAVWKDGELVSLGREDDQVKLRGFRIELGEIEEVLREHPAIINGAAAVQELSPGNHVLVAYFQKHQEEIVIESEISEWLAERLPEYMEADFIVELPFIPQTLNGKTDRKQLPLPNVNRKEHSNENVAERVEDTILNIWKKVLGDKEIGLNDSFFDIGGKSFSLVLVHDELEKKFPGVVTVADLFALSTISKLKEYIVDVGQKTVHKGKFALPEAWFDVYSKEEGQVETMLELGISNAVKDLGFHYGLDFSETLFGLFALYLHKSHRLERVPLWTIGYMERAACVNFDFHSYSDLGQVLKDLSASFPTQKDFQTINSLDLITSSDEHVRVGFVNENDMDSRKLLKKFDFYLVVHKKQDQIKLSIIYGRRTAANTLQTQLKQFVKMVSLVVEKIVSLT